MKFRFLSMIAVCAVFVFTSRAQGPHDQLIEMTRSKAGGISTALGLSDESRAQLAQIYVNEALAIERLIVNAEPEVSVMDQVNYLREMRYDQVRDLLDKEEFDLYKHYLEQEELRQRSRFDSVQFHLKDAEFQAMALAYYDDEVSPYLLYYHQTYFKPALKQKHEWKINLARLYLNDYESALRSAASGDATPLDVAQAREDMEKGVQDLRKIRKRYRDELDYISVALGSVERIWTEDYIKMVQEHFPDEIYQQIKSYRYSMNAYGMDYMLGTLSMILFDVRRPRSYIESRNTLAEVYGFDLTN